MLKEIASISCSQADKKQMHHQMEGGIKIRDWNEVAVEDSTSKSRAPALGLWAPKASHPRGWWKLFILPKILLQLLS